MWGVLVIALLLFAIGGNTAAAQQSRPPLSARDVDDIARLVMLEDRRDYDEATLARLLDSNHPEVRRRAAQSIARIADPRGRALVLARVSDRDTAVAATAVLAIGQLADTAAVARLDTLLNTRATPVTVAAEAARSLGKIPTSQARTALARYLVAATENTGNTPTIG
ncbi:MAG: HEAT repeat domain-containing protein, partial [Longimicrobiales bacterium]